MFRGLLHPTTLQSRDADYDETGDPSICGRVQTRSQRWLRCALLCVGRSICLLLYEKEKDQDWDCVGFQMFGFWHVCRLFLFDFRCCCCCVPLFALVVVESSCCCGYRVWFCDVAAIAVVGVSALLLLLSMLLGDEYAINSKKLGAQRCPSGQGLPFPFPCWWRFRFWVYVTVRAAASTCRLPQLSTVSGAIASTVDSISKYCAPRTDNDLQALVEHLPLVLLSFPHLPLCDVVQDMICVRNV